jgi:hypothetical protein
MVWHELALKGGDIMAREISIFITLSLFVFGSISLSGADSGSADKRDIVIDNAIGGMREGSRIVSPDTYGTKTQIPKVPGTRLSPITDTRVVAGAPAADAVKAGIFTEGQSSNAAAGINEGAPGAGGSSIAGPPGTGTGNIGAGSGSESGSGVGTTADSGGSLINVGAGADLSSGSVDAGVSLDTDNTDKILEADLAAGAGETADISGSTDIAAGDLTADSTLPDEITGSAVSSETDIGTEVDTSGSSVGSEAEIGVEADIEGGGEGGDVANDPADGLPGL